MNGLADAWICQGEASNRGFLEPSEGDYSVRNVCILAKLLLIRQDAAIIIIIALAHCAPSCT
jgi:hypothetical protein